MGADFSYVTGVGLLGAVILLIASLRAGRERPHIQVLWIIGIAALAVSIIFRFTIFIGASLQGFALATLPIMIGNLAVILVLVSAFWQPLWTGWFLIGSAIAMPIISFLFEFVIKDVEPEDIATPGVLLAYAIPALITGVLFLISMRKPATVDIPVKTSV